MNIEWPILNWERSTRWRRTPHLCRRNMIIVDYHTDSKFAFANLLESLMRYFGNVPDNRVSVCVCVYVCVCVCQEGEIQKRKTSEDRSIISPRILGKHFGERIRKKGPAQNSSAAVLSAPFGQQLPENPSARDVRQEESGSENPSLLANGSGSFLTVNIRVRKS